MVNCQNLCQVKIDLIKFFRNNVSVKLKYFYIILIFIISILLSCVAYNSVEKDIQNKTESTETGKTAGNESSVEPEGLSILKEAYPDIDFTASYDEEMNDWKILIDTGTRSGELYWCGGRFLPADKLADKDSYWKLFYKYSEEIPDPADFSPKEVERIRKFSSPENRREGASSPQFFYDLIYDCESRRAVEQHIIQISFLGKRSNVHERIKEPLAVIEKQILEATKTDEEVKNFVDTLSRADSYNWREISDSGNRSFHSMGIAVDVLPRGWGQKNIYWAWRRDIDPENWMLLPLDRRWMPPRQVIRIFENNGFIWGGKWMIWDNMHFEYRPEVILYSKILNAAPEK